VSTRRDRYAGFAAKHGEWLTMSEAAPHRGAIRHSIRRFIKGQVLCVDQVMSGAPYRIRLRSLNSEKTMRFGQRPGVLGHVALFEPVRNLLHCHGSVLREQSFRPR